MIAVGQKLPNATLYEFYDEATEGCAIGPNAFEV
jgi:peroxiredoxin (alkyl hydroperoxide reductase subunit C)